jgi:hypothetical protein
MSQNKSSSEMAKAIVIVAIIAAVVYLVRSGHQEFVVICAFIFFWLCVLGGI